MRLKSIPRALSSVLLVAALCNVHHAHGEERAPPPTGEDRAFSLFNESEVAYREARFEESLRLLREAYALSPDPVLLYNMARVHETMGDLDRAISVYERFLMEAPSIPDRPALEARIASLKALREAKKPKPPPPRKRSVAPWIVAGAGGAVLAGAGVFGILAKNRESDAINDPVQRTGVAAREDATTYATIANVGFAVGGAIALAGLVWGLVASTTSPTPSASTSPATVAWRPMGFEARF
jgi:tetratricopeptide (TPR) repeat protein